MIKNKFINFSTLLIIAALLAASISAFFSIVGISTLFSGTLISAAIMAGSLEFSKIMSVTFLYRYWKKCKFYFKTCLIIFTFIIMIITSAGIFGFLSSGYQTTSIEFGIVQEKITNIQDQKTYYKDKIDVSKKRIDDLTKLRYSEELRMNEPLNNELLSRNPLQLKQLQQQTIDLITETDTSIKDENTKIQISIDDIRKIDDQINQLKLETAKKKDIQTFKFVADAFGVSLNTVSKWFIIIISAIFDPISVCLILAYNVAVYRKEDESVYDIPKLLKTEPEPTLAPVAPPPATPISISPVSVISPKIEKVEEKKEEKKSDMSEWFRQYFKL